MIFRWPLCVTADGALKVSVLDGDTVDVIIDLGLGLRASHRLRLDGVNAPEIHSTNLKEKAAGLKVASIVESWVKARAGKLVMARSNEKPEKFGRLLGDLDECDTPDGLGLEVIGSLTGYLFAIGAVKPYHGEKKPEWTDGELLAIMRHPL